MEFIVEFYQELDTLNLIIFWGIIIVIVLLLIFSFILINKNKKLKNIVATTIKKEEDLPIKKIEPENNINKNIKTESEIENIEPEKEIVLPDIPNILPKEKSNQIETERTFVAEEHVRKYNNDDFVISNIKKISEEIHNNETENKRNISKEIEIPTKPYQRNVLREMSLSQTSPIGITRPINKENKKIELAKDLEDALNQIQEEKTKEITRESSMKQKEVLKKELSKIEDLSQRKTEIIHDENRNERREQEKIIIPREEKKITEKVYNENDNHIQNNDYLKRNQELNKVENVTRNTNYERKKEKTLNDDYMNIKNEYIPPQVKELLDKSSTQKKDSNIKSSSEKYLEEVSRKLAEAEMTDEIERTDYELEQEENAIISYKELMEKKDSIQTIDEEEAIISIEELMNKNSNKSNQNEEIKEETKLYNLTEEEENDNFLKELKQFRNDL